jgi:phage tail-like protein
MAPRANRANSTVKDPAVAYMFKVEIDGKKLGLWNSFEGLGMETTIETREEGGNNAFVHQLPGRLKYTNVKISRPVGRDSQLVANWLSGLTESVSRTTAVITALGPDSKDIVSWSLNGVVIVKWTGPGFNVEQPKVAVETLELAYHGFLEAAKPAAGG